MNAAHDLAKFLSLEERVVLVTGGAGGIGSSVVTLFLQAGAHVVSTDLPGRGSAPGAQEIDCDLTDRQSVARLFEGIRQRFDRLDVLIHCAGVTRDRVLWKLEYEDWSEVLRVNLDSAFLLLREAVPLMRPLGDGSIVLVSSINGERGKFGQSNYAASKAGLIGLARTAARELGKFGIRVNVIAPGMIETPMTASLPPEVIAEARAESPLGRLGRPEDVAHSALFLASSMARHITGQVIRVDGGQLIA